MLQCCCGRHLKFDEHKSRLCGIELGISHTAVAAGDCVCVRSCSAVARDGRVRLREVRVPVRSGWMDWGVQCGADC
jgi:hypothetical protein